jgi:hypothetical protein
MFHWLRSALVVITTAACYIAVRYALVAFTAIH